MCPTASRSSRTAAAASSVEVPASREGAAGLARRAGRLHSLRHYSATELIAAGTDVRTVAGRLGHGSGGATTLKIHAAWVDEAGQRAATAARPLSGTR